MSQVELVLPDGKVLAAEPGTPYRDVVRGIGEGLLRNALAVQVAGVNHTLEDPVDAGGTFKVITRGTEDGYDTLRHSTAHLMAWAVQELFPGVKFALLSPWGWFSITWRPFRSRSARRRYGMCAVPRVILSIHSARSWGSDVLLSFRYSSVVRIILSTSSFRALIFSS